MKHELKTDKEVFQATIDGLKDFEIRFNDRDFKVGDTLILLETVHSGADISNGRELLYTERSATKTVKYILNGGRYGLADGWVILGVKDLIDFT